MNAKMNVPQENSAPYWWEQCYTAEDGQIFTPRFDRATGAMTHTAQEAYAEWLAGLNAPPTPTVLNPRDLAIAQLMRDVATLKGGTAHV